MASLGIYIDEDWEINRSLNNSCLKRRISPVKIPSNIFPAQSTNLGESASLPQYLGCNTVFDMRLRVTFLRRKTVSLQSSIAHRK